MLSGFLCRSYDQKSGSTMRDIVTPLLYLSRTVFVQCDWYNERTFGTLSFQQINSSTDRSPMFPIAFAAILVAPKPCANIPRYGWSMIRC